MIKNIFIVICIVFSVSQNKSIREVEYNGLEPYLNKTNDTLYIINFWATWCAPCVEELPYFEKLNKEMNGKKFKMYLVSLDFDKKKLANYVNKHKLKAEVILLNDNDQNTWIPKVNKKWTGAIPATLIYKGTKRKFYERNFTYNQLLNQINLFKN